ncbi:MAG: PP2C family serine/threonine-protein phosphatase [Planctomycetaceae bacterium]
MRWEQPVQYASLSDIGFRRQNNQDSFAIRICTQPEQWRAHGHLFMVADGMGGHAVGELASKIAADTIPHHFFKTREPDVTISLREAIEAANNTIYERGSHNRDFERMGTTCTTLALTPVGAVIGHVGDSRLYRIRNDRIDQLTFDHSLQWELIRQGKMRAEDVFLHEPRHVITRSLGPEPKVQVDIEGPYPTLPGDIYVLCSDGLISHVADAEIGTIAKELAPADACRLLVNLANLRGGSDNITVVVLKVGKSPDGADELIEDLPAPGGGVNWWWLLAVWMVVLTFVGGVSLSLFGYFLQGVAAAAIAAFAAVGLFAYWLEKRPRAQLGADDSEAAETRVWRPYRTASAKFNRRFLSHLAAIESELQRAATDEGWTIDWSVHEAAYRKAKDSLDKHEYTRAFADFGKVIDILMIGLHQFRKQASREAKWGRPAAPPTGTTPPPTTPMPTPAPGPAAKTKP